MGAVVIADKFNHPTCVQPDMHLVNKGVIVDGLATAMWGLVGASGTNYSTSSVGISLGTQATSRVIGVAVAA